MDWVTEIHRIWIHTMVINELNQRIHQLFEMEHENQGVFLLEFLFLNYRMYREIFQRKSRTDPILAERNMSIQEFQQAYFETLLENHPEPSIVQFRLSRLLDTIQQLVEERRPLLRRNIPRNEVEMIRELIQQRSRAIFNSSSTMDEFNDNFSIFINEVIWPRIRRTPVEIEYPLEESNCAESECAFCLEPLIHSSRIKLQPCNHCFHAYCPSGHAPIEFFTEYGVCPLCRSEPAVLRMTDS